MKIHQSFVFSSFDFDHFWISVNRSRSTLKKKIRNRQPLPVPAMGEELQTNKSLY